MEERLEQIILEIPNGYEFYGINDDNKVVLAKKQPQCPKTYEECCMVLQDACMTHKGGYKSDLIQTFQKLLICRDAYWKIAGEQMGLGKPWEPDWKELKVIKYTIQAQQGYTYTYYDCSRHNVLSFPTREMRDAFYENFKKLIEGCKELL